MAPDGGPLWEDASSDQNRYRLLLAATDLVARAKSLPDAFKELAPPVLALTGGDMLNLSLHDPHRDCMLTRYWKRDHESGEFSSQPVEEAASGWAWKNQEPVAIPDTEREHRFPACVPVLLNHGVRSYTAVPISTPSVCLGALGLGKKFPQALNNEDVEFLSRIAELGALRLEKEKAQRALEKQQSLVAIIRELSSSLELDKLLPVIFSGLQSIGFSERAFLSVLDADQKRVYRYGDALERDAFINHGTIPLERALSARAIQTRRVMFLTATDLEQMNDPLAEAMHQAGIRSVCSLPLIAGDRIWGALNPMSRKDGAFGPAEVEYLQQVANHVAMALNNVHAYGEIVQLKERLAQEKSSPKSEIQEMSAANGIVGGSPALKRVLDYAAIVADTDCTVLITGETGTGKERIARLIHSMSGRKGRSFIKLNCAAIPTGLLESELFGHEKGAFTGAVSQKIGRLELADKGTLLLDEIGDIPLDLQPKLLRVLQDQEFERLGGTRTIRVNVRLIAATNRNLAQAVADKQFRADLFYRLHVFPLHMPPLRDRREDIPILTSHFVEKCCARLNKRVEIIPDAVLGAMMRWNWPGNIRELENFVERSVILSEGNRLTSPLGELRDAISYQGSDSDVTLHERERGHIVEILRQTRGALSGPGGAAARLGLKRTTLQYKMQRLGISRTDYLR